MFRIAGHAELAQTRKRAESNERTERLPRKVAHPRSEAE